MKTTINNKNGIIVTNGENGIVLEGRDFRESPFDDRWDDLYANIDEGVGPAALTYEAYRDTGFYMRFFVTIKMTIFSCHIRCHINGIRQLLYDYICIIYQCLQALGT